MGVLDSGWPEPSPQVPGPVPEPATKDDLARLKASMMAFLMEELGVRDEDIVQLQRRLDALDGGREF